MDNNRLQLFKEERSIFNRPISLPLDAARSKFEVDDRKISGYPIVWGERNDYGEIVIKGATQNSLNARGVESSKNPIVVLNQHRTSEILCRPSVLREDEYGLYFEGDVILGVQYADEALAQIRQGVLKQLSYGFNYIWDKVEYDSTLDSYILGEIYLGEISPVTFSSGPSAQLRSYREIQTEFMLRKYTSDEISDLETLLKLSRGAVTNTPEDLEDNSFTKLLKLF